METQIALNPYFVDPSIFEGKCSYAGTLLDRLNVNLRSALDDFGILDRREYAGSISELLGRIDHSHYLPNILIRAICRSIPFENWLDMIFSAYYETYDPNVEKNERRTVSQLHYLAFEDYLIMRLPFVNGDELKISVAHIINSPLYWR